MLQTMLIAAVAVFVVAGLIWSVSRDRRGNEVARFQRAREITSSWVDPAALQAADESAAHPPVRVPDAPAAETKD
jgi:hypothetical protein